MSAITQRTLYSRPILKKLEFSGQICEKYSTTNFMKIRPLGAQLFTADRRADMTKLLTILRKLLETKCENNFSVEKESPISYNKHETNCFSVIWTENGQHVF
jgi:hypothetical protein